MGQMADGEDLRKILHHRRSMRRAAKCEDDLWEAQQGRSYCGHLRPSLSVSVLDIDLRVLGLLKPRGRDIFKSRS